MPILRALIVMLVVPLAFANETENCDEALAGAFGIPLSKLTRNMAFAPYDLFVPDYAPWVPRGQWIVGQSPDKNTTWRVNFLSKRMVYERKNLRGGVGLVNLARIASRAALGAHANGVDLSSIQLSFSPEGTLIVDLPMTQQGTEFVIALENRVNHVRDFAPIDLMRWPSYVNRLPINGDELEVQTTDAPAVASRRSWRTWWSKLQFWKKKARAAVAAESAPESTPNAPKKILPPLPEKIRAFSDEQVAFVSAWLETQFPGLHIHAFNQVIRYEVPAPRGMRDVVAHARRVSELAIKFARPGLNLGDLSISVSSDAKTFQIQGIPWNQTGALFIEQFEALRAREEYVTSSAIIPGLSLDETERVRALLVGLEPTILYAKGETSYFVRPPDEIPLSAEELEAIHQAKGGALPRELRKAFVTLTRNESTFNAFAPWTHEPRADENDDDLWTAQKFDVDATINITTGRISFAFLGNPGQARERVERALASLFSTKDYFDFSSLKLELGHGPFSGKLILSSSIDRLATRVLSEIRIPAEIDTRPFTIEQRRRATAWFQEQYDDARAARGGATPVRTAAE